MTAVGRTAWAVGDECDYRLSDLAASPSPCIVAAIDGLVLAITTVSRHPQTFYVFSEEITRRAS